jgi:OOP family OmpA-OmpF porin
MKRTSVIAAGVFLSSLSVGGAYAQTPGVQLNMDSGMYIGAGGGKANLTGPCSGVCDTKDTTWSLFAGYQFNKFLAVEAAYTDLGQQTTSGLISGVPVTSRMDTTLWELVGIGALPVTDQISFFAKAGIFRYEGEANTTGAFVGATKESGTEFTFGGGAQYAFTSNLAARFEWQRYMQVGANIPGFEKEDIGVWRLSARYKF